MTYEFLRSSKSLSRSWVSVALAAGEVDNGVGGDEDDAGGDGVAVAYVRLDPRWRVTFTAGEQAAIRVTAGVYWDASRGKIAEVDGMQVVVSMVWL